MREEPAQKEPGEAEERGAREREQRGQAGVKKTTAAAV